MVDVGGDEGADLAGDEGFHGDGLAPEGDELDLVGRCITVDVDNGADFTDAQAEGRVSSMSVMGESSGMGMGCLWEGVYRI